MAHDRTVLQRPRAASEPRVSAAVTVARASPQPGVVGLRGQRALHEDEVARCRGMATILGTLCIVAGTWFPLLGGDPALMIPAIAAAAYLGIVCAVVLVRARPDHHYRLLFRWFAVS